MEKSKQQPSVAEILEANCSWIKFLISIVSIWVVVALGFMCFKHVVFEISWSNSRISLANFLSLGAAIGAIAVAVFAWLAYHYATHQYLRNEIEKLKFEKKYQFTLDIYNEMMALNDPFAIIYLECSELCKKLQSKSHDKFDKEMKDKISNILLGHKQIGTVTTASIAKIPGLFLQVNLFKALGCGDKEISGIKKLRDEYLTYLVELLGDLGELEKSMMTEFSASVDGFNIIDQNQVIVYFQNREEFYLENIGKLKTIITELGKISQEFLHP